MSSAKKISFVIPCYNDGRFLSVAIASIEACKVNPFEIIIVDNGSTDEATKEVMERLRSQNYRIVYREGGGPAGARNSGIEVASGQYILPLDADNKIRPDFIEKAVQVLDSKPDVSIVHSDFKYFGLGDHVCHIPEFDIKKMLYANYIDTCAVFRRDVWVDCGGYDTDGTLVGLEDWDFWLNAYLHGKKFHHLKMIGFDYAWREGSVFSTLKKSERYGAAEQRIYEKYALLLRDHYREYSRWDFHGNELLRRPIRTILRLLVNSISKRAHDRLFKIQRIP